MIRSTRNGRNLSIKQGCCCKSHQLDERSRVNREIHARICGSVGVKFLCATRPDHRIRHGPNNKEDLNVSAIDLLAARLSFAKFLSLVSIRHSGKWGKCKLWLPNCMDHRDGKKISSHMLYGRVGNPVGKGSLEGNPSESP